ncbi:MAG: hypothetical protein BJ554DRAFT_3240, partial [Olpidium bornovanus]
MPDTTSGAAAARPRSSRPRTAGRKDATDDCGLPTVAAWKRGKGEIPIAARFKALSPRRTFLTRLPPGRSACASTPR